MKLKSKLIFYIKIIWILKKIIVFLLELICDWIEIIISFKLYIGMGCDQQWDHYTKMHANSFWVSLDFEWIWTFLSSEIG